MAYVRLSEHKYRKGIFTTPINSIPNMTELNDEKSWNYGRMPEYLWIGLILHKYGRSEGLNKLFRIIIKLHELAPDLLLPRMSDILDLDSNTQTDFFNYIIDVSSKEALSPLTLIMTISETPEFAQCCYSRNMSFERRKKELIETMEKIAWHQSNEATDVRFVIVSFLLLTNKLHIPKDHLDMLLKYPELKHEDEEMRMIRPSVRATELALLQMEKANKMFLEYFWRRISEMTDCTLYSMSFPKEEANIDLYMEQLHEVFSYLSKLFLSTNPLDDKMNVIVGIGTYSYKQFREAYEHNLFNAISGRGCIRLLIENYINLKYLIKNESKHKNIWREYQYDGIGKYKLVLARQREYEVRPQSHFDKDYIEALVNEYKDESFIDMDTRYFDNQNMRAKAEGVDEKELYGLLYDYDSSFEHGLWGAIRESALLKCGNPAHQYHCVPDVDFGNRLKSILPDCIMVMNKTIAFINTIYGLPSPLFEEVIKFEI